MATKPRSNRRTDIADAAIAVLASEGSRGLTHRAVDRHLGIPEGSTSHYYRTRKALLGAAMARMIEATLEETTAVQLTGLSHANAARRMADMFEHDTPVIMQRRVARYELMLEASRDEELREAVEGVIRQQIDQAERMLREAGCDDPKFAAPLVTLLLSSLLLHRLVLGETIIPADDLAEHIQRLIDRY